MSATSAARAYTRDIAGEAVRMIQASDSPFTVSALERAYAPLRPTIYRPSRPSITRGYEEREGNSDAGWLSLGVLCVVVLVFFQ